MVKWDKWLHVHQEKRRGDTQNSLVCTVSKIQKEDTARASYLVDQENSLISTKSASWGWGFPNLCSLWLMSLFFREVSPFHCLR